MRRGAVKFDRAPFIALFFMIYAFSEGIAYLSGKSPRFFKVAALQINYSSVPSSSSAGTSAALSSGACVSASSSRSVSATVAT